jgi:hypothetical protein
MFYLKKKSLLYKYDNIGSMKRLKGSLGCVAFLN